MVLLFLGIVVLGWFGQKFNFGRGTDLQSHLCKSELAGLYKLMIITNDTVEIIRTDAEWIAGYNDDNILFPDSLAQSVLAAITSMESMYFIKTERPDTLGFFEKEAVGIQCFSTTHPKKESFILGKTIIVNGATATWVAIKGHEQYYLAKGDLKSPLQIRWDVLKPVKRFLADTAAVSTVVVWFENDTLYYNRTHTPAADSLQTWLTGFYQLTGNAPEANFFDVEHEDHPSIGQVQFVREDQPEPLVYHLYYVAQPTLPDDPAKLKQFKDFKPQYVIAAGKNPGIFFAISDTLVVRQVMTGR